MSDEADRAAPRIEAAITDGLIESRRAVAAMPTGEPGECNGCGEYFSRTVDGYCGRCRDKFAGVRRC